MRRRQSSDEEAGDGASAASVLADVTIPAWIAAGLTAFFAAWVMLVPLSSLADGGGLQRDADDIVPTSAEKEVGGPHAQHHGLLSVRTAISPVAVPSTAGTTHLGMGVLKSCKRLFAIDAAKMAQKACKMCSKRLQETLGAIIAALCAVYAWAAVDAAAARRAEVHSLVLLANFATSVGLNVIGGLLAIRGTRVFFF